MHGRQRWGAHAVATLAAALALTGFVAQNAFAADITGTWHLPGGSVADQTWTISAGTGTLAGEGAGGFYTWPIEGTISGSAVQIKTAYRGSGYVAYFVGTVSADGATMSGTWANGSFEIAAMSTKTWTADRAGGAPPPTAPPAAAVAVICNRGPDPDSVFTCTATVGGSSAPPGGTVAWTTTKGGFPLGASCTLVATPLSPNVSSCSVQWNPGPGGFPAGVAPPVKATYGGDAKAGAGSGAPQLYGIAAIDPKLPPNLCVLNDSCDGIDVVTSGKARLNTKTGQLATLSTGCYSGAGAKPKAAARAAQVPVFTCAADAEAYLSELGDAEIESMIGKAQKLIASASKADQLKGQQLIKQANQRFEQIVAALKAAGEGAVAALDPDFDARMDRAQKLLASPKRADQIRGQQLLEVARKLFDARAKEIEDQSQRAAGRVRDSAVHRRKAVTLASGSVSVASGQRGVLRLRVPAKSRTFFAALRKAGLRSVTLRLQLAGRRSGDALTALQRTTLRVTLR